MWSWAALIESAFNQTTSLLHEYGFQLSSREWAGLFWLVVAAIACLQMSRVRISIAHALKTALGPKVYPIWLVYLAWIIGFIWISNLLGYWENALGKLTFVWAITTGIVLVSRFPDASNSGFFREIIGGVIGITILIEYFTALATFSFWIELILQPFLAILAVLLVVLERNDDSQVIKGAIGAILVLFAVFLLGYSIQELLVAHVLTDVRFHALQMFWPILLTFWILPLIYILAVIGAYEMAFLQMSRIQDQSRVTWKSGLGMILAFGLRLKWTHEAGKGGTIDLAKSKSVREAYRAGREFVRQKFSEMCREKKYQNNLIRFAGSEKVDGNGRLLDKREFRETVQALYWLHACQSGWYSREPKGYKADLLDRLGDDFSMQGLSPPSGITMHVSEDGRRWYAWRRTPCGQYFAIGADGPPPDQWLYDGPIPPSNYPGLSSEWGGAPFSDENALNWID